MKILFINACIRENSRTLILAKELLNNLDGDIKEINLPTLNLLPLTTEDAINQRVINPNMQVYAKEFSEADNIVIAAPMYDMSFPAILKIYIENITIAGITFKYTSNGLVGLCNGKKLYYVSTSGGIFIEDFGYNYIKSLAKNLFGIKNVIKYSVSYLDVYKDNVNAILAEEILNIKNNE